MSSQSFQNRYWHLSWLTATDAADAATVSLAAVLFDCESAVGVAEKKAELRAHSVHPLELQLAQDSLAPVVYAGALELSVAEPG